MNYFLIFLSFISHLAFGSEVELAKVKIKNECWANETQVAFNIYFDVQYNEPTSQRVKTIYHLVCSRKDKACEGTSINLSTTTISLMSLNQVEGAKLISSKESFHVIEWGPLRVFSVDTNRKLVTYRESGKGIVSEKMNEGFAETKCE